MRGGSIAAILAAAAMAAALAACGQERQATGEERADGKGEVAAGAQSGRSNAALALQAQLDAAFVGKTTPPDPEGFTQEGGHVDQAGSGEILITYGRWARAGGSQPVMLVSRSLEVVITDAEGRGYTRSQITQAFPMPAPQANEHLFIENCRSSEYAEEAANIYANASPAGGGVTNTPSAAWRLDRATARLLPIDATNVTCAFDEME
jgi:hypothetical protein